MADFRVVFSIDGQPSRETPYRGTLADVTSHADRLRYIDKAAHVEVFDHANRLVIVRSRRPKQLHHG